MRYRLLGNSGLRVSEAALGTMTFGDDWGWGAAKDEARKVYDAFREAGGNFIDTANFYTNGTSESFLGEFMQGHRQSVVMEGFMTERQQTDRIIAAVKTVSEETGRSMAQVALAWLRYRPVTVIPIIGARKLSQLQDNLASLDLSLSADQLKRLDEASRIELGFPHDFYEREMVNSIRYGGMREQILA
ncbi:MAG: putative oxidoreductase, aryl-alcohol dehydrogenase like protein [Bryobacterales bacterium]|nr:putative oxidoreductase, aryl-alcohol dehydrogenase like protein [Bryobacterales bacterium]